MYNLIHGVNPMTPILLKALDMRYGKISPEGKWHPGRFRDIHLSGDGTTIILFTRNGGGNRKCYEGIKACEEADEGLCFAFTRDTCPPRMNELLKTHPLYIKDYDDDYDSTYAYFEFKTPERLDEFLDKILELQGGSPLTLKEKSNMVIREMRSMTAEEIKNDPRFAPLVKIVEDIVEKTKDG